MHLNTLHSLPPSFIPFFSTFTKSHNKTPFINHHKQVSFSSMDRSQGHQVQVHTHGRYEGGGGGGMMKQLLPSSGPTTGQVIAVVTLLPVTAALLGLAGITLVGTLIGLALATPLFVICSPVLVPAAILLAGTVAAFMTSGAFGLTGLSSLSWVINSFRQATGSGREPVEFAKRKMQDVAVGTGEKTRQTGEMMKSKAEGGREGGAATAGKTA